MLRKLLSGFLQVARDAGGRAFIRVVNRGVRRIAAFTHALQYAIEWGATTPIPGWFDHHLDQYYVWQKTGNPLMWERGIFGLLAMSQGAEVLELCCGDGFNADRFYAIRAASVTAVDLDPYAIRMAKRNHRAPNVHYAVADIRVDLPAGPFDNIVWDASLEYFSEDEIAALMREIRVRIRRGGVFSGCAIVQQAVLPEHVHFFRGKDDLMSFLSPYFSKVRVFETQYPSRHNLYFFAGEGVLPFDEQWPQQLVSHEAST